MKTAIALAYISNDGSNDVLMAVSEDPSTAFTWSHSLGVPEARSNGTSPAICSLGTTRVIAFSDKNNKITTMTFDGESWTSPTPASVPIQPTFYLVSSIAPALAVSQDNTVNIAYVGEEFSRAIMATAAGKPPFTEWAFGADGYLPAVTTPAISAIPDNLIVLATVGPNDANAGENIVYFNLCENGSMDGATVALGIGDNPQIATNLSPALITIGSRLIVVFVSEGSGELLLMYSTNVSNSLDNQTHFIWQGFFPIVGPDGRRQSSKSAAALTIDSSNNLVIAYVSPGEDNLLQIATSPLPDSIPDDVEGNFFQWSNAKLVNGPSDPSPQSTKAAPALCQFTLASASECGTIISELEAMIRSVPPVPAFTPTEWKAELKRLEYCVAIGELTEDDFDKLVFDYEAYVEKKASIP